MNDKQLFKMCLTYVKALKQPITRAELIKLLEKRVNILEERVHKTEKNKHD